jgi:O-antigen/teichoic acid export membrane protein
MGKTSATGSSRLFVGRIASALMLAIGTLIVELYINERDYGLYTVVLLPAAAFLLF